MSGSQICHALCHFLSGVLWEVPDILCTPDAVEAHHLGTGAESACSLTLVRFVTAPKMEYAQPAHACLSPWLPLPITSGKCMLMSTAVPGGGGGLGCASVLG